MEFRDYFRACIELIEEAKVDYLNLSEFLRNAER